MKSPYNGILVVSILLVVLYFLNEQKPAYIPADQDRKDMLFFGILYVALLFGTFSLIYMYYKQGSNNRQRRNK